MIIPCETTDTAARPEMYEQESIGELGARMARAASGRSRPGWALGTGNPQRGKGTILVVDDERSIVELVSLLLRSAGYTVIATSDIGTALQAVSHTEIPIDLLISDVMMPDMNGVELAIKLRETRPEVPVLFISGHCPVDHHFHDMQGTTLLAKPFGFMPLLNTVQQILGARDENREVCDKQRTMIKLKPWRRTPVDMAVKQLECVQMKTNLTILVGGAMLALVAANANADTILFSATYPGPTLTDVTRTNWGTSPTGSGNHVYFYIPLFDPALGTLQSVTFSLVGRVAGRMTITNNESEATDVTGQLTATIDAYLDRVISGEKNVKIEVTPADEMETTIAAGEVESWTTDMDADTDPEARSDLTLTAPSELRDVTGSGTKQVEIRAVAHSNASGGGNLSTTFVTLAGADMTVSYTYLATPVPVPTSVWSGGVLLCGLVIRRLRRHARSQ